ncbi:hypothetical protein CRYUN_Cryun21dG0085000 [Craigia yunnanensis]
MAGSTSRFKPNSRNVESSLDEPRMYTLRVRRQIMGPSIRFVGSCQLCSSARVQVV